MEDKPNIESIGFIIKKEKLASLASEVHFQEMVLEDLDPFPGFYDQYFTPLNENEQKPRSVFLILKVSEDSRDDEYIRATMHLKQEHTVKFDAVPGSLTLFNKQTPCLRVFMDNYNQIAELIIYYKQKGLQFAAYKEVKSYQSLIKLRRYFEMERMDIGIYHAIDQHNTYYIEVPKFLEWDNFEQVTIGIRNNWDHKLYDAAQAAVYEKKGIIDMVRIYDKKTNLKNLQFLKAQYNFELSRS